MKIEFAITAGEGTLLDFGTVNLDGTDYAGQNESVNEFDLFTPGVVIISGHAPDDCVTGQ